IAALARHFDEQSRTNFNESYYEWEKGWVDKKWINYEPTSEEIKEIQAINQKSNSLKLKHEKTPPNKGQIRLLKAINKIESQSQQQNVKPNNKTKKLKKIWEEKPKFNILLENF
ncbi:hypothetical protein ER70_08430, partial (plasmid) [Borreliella bissettiae]